MKISGAQLIIEALKKENVDVLFGYPGGKVIPIFDVLYTEPSIKLILPRHEQGAVHAADGYARATGKTGVCLVTSGPGATNTVTGLATANFDSVPIVCFTGQVPTNMIGNDAFQEADIIGITRPITKHNYQVYDRKDLGRIIKEAFYIASTGRPGPVLIDLPIDVVKAEAEDSYPEKVQIRGYKPITKGDPELIKEAASKLMKTRKPLFFIGGGLHVAGACETFKELVNKTGVPVVSSLLGIGVLSSNNPLNFGMIGMHGSYAANMAVTNCDLLFAIGTRFDDRATGKLSEFAPHAEIIHVDIDRASTSRNVPISISIVGDAKLVLDEILPLVDKIDTEPFIKQLEAWKETYPLKVAPGIKRLSPIEVIKSINEVFPEALVATDVGQHQMWTAQFFQFEDPRPLISSGGLGTMGYGLPAGIGAQIGKRDKRVVVISGDGSFQMNIQELSTAVSEELPIVICVINNGYLGMVRQWQEVFFDKKYSGTCLRRKVTCPPECNTPSEKCPTYIPDFVKIAEGYGAIGIRVEKIGEVIPALKKAREFQKIPVVIEFLVEQEANVLPLVPEGVALSEMILDGGN